MIRGFLACFFLSFATSVVAQPVGTVTAQEWSRPRHGEALVDLPGLNDAVNSYLRRPHTQIVIHHPVEEEGLFWAEELKGWLVALGVKSSSVRLVPAPVPSDMVELYVE